MKPQRWYQKKEKKNDYALVGVQNPLPGCENLAKTKVLTKKIPGRRAWFLIPVAVFVCVVVGGFKSTYAADTAVPIESRNQIRAVLLGIDRTVAEQDISYVYERFSMLPDHAAYSNPAATFHNGDNVRWQYNIDVGADSSVGVMGRLLWVDGGDGILGNADDVRISDHCDTAAPASCVAGYVDDYKDFVGYYKKIAADFKAANIISLQNAVWPLGQGTWSYTDMVPGSFPIAPATTTYWEDTYGEVTYEGYTVVVLGVYSAMISWLTDSWTILMSGLVDLLPYVLLCFGAGIAFAIFQTVYEEITYKKKL